jgi:hypothetical protein
MNLFDKFFIKYGYKFPKGYPDMNNEQDILLMESILEQILGESIELKELTVDPDYRSKGVFNPFYTISSDLDTEVKSKLKEKGINANTVIYKAVKQPGTNIILNTGKIPFELFSDETTSLKSFITIPKNKVEAHYGAKGRKDSTASSNVNEFLSLYFLAHPGDFKGGAEAFINKVNSKKGDTGVLTGDGESITYERLAQLLSSDESPERDIKIGYNNSVAVKKDIGSSWDVLYWTPRAKPEGIASNNPSDIIIKLDDGSFQGYSNKIAAGKDVTPKFNTNIIAFYSKKGDETQVNNIKQLIDLSWNEAAKTVPSSAKNAKKAIKSFNISDEDFSETSSKASFAELAREFEKDGLNFYGEDFYYKFRNNFITNFSEYLEDPVNLKYFINTIGFYTYGDEAATSTPCPYKLLIGSESGSTIKDVSEDQQLKDIITTKSTKNIKNISNSYDGSSQSFVINFNYKLGNENKSVSIPVTTRTRASGGWSGKALYINTPGVKIS